MNYKKHYDILIDRAKNRILESYTETHHILPKCLGGLDDPSNLVELTPEEHYVAHQLLVKMYPNNWGIIHAAILMTTDKFGKRIHNKQFGWIRKKNSKQLSERNLGNKYALGYKQTKEHINKRIKMGRIVSKETKEKIRLTNLGHMDSKETRLKKSLSKLGKKQSQRHLLNRKNSLKKSWDNQERRKEASIRITGNKHPQFGKMWITNGIESKLINKIDIIPQGFAIGRVIKF